MTEAPPLTRDDLLALDRDDPLAHVRDEFDINPDLVYLDGNSLGVPPRGVAERVAAVIEQEWRLGLIRSWTTAGWIDTPARVGAKLARMLGAAGDEVVVADSTSVNLFKLLIAALRARPGRHVVLTEDANFPTDLYIADGVAALLRREGVSVRRVPRERLLDALDDDVAVLFLTHVHYTTGRVHDMRALTEAAHRAGALALWDLSHSAGAVPVDLHAADADLAVGCGYKYLNGGPGAPACLFAARRLHDSLQSVLPGWMGHAAPFEFSGTYRPAPGVLRHLCGTPPIISLAALEVAVDLWLRIDMAAVRSKSMRLGDLFIRLVDERCAAHGFEVVSPRDATVRGSQVSLRHDDGYAVMQALIDRGVIGDFRAPDVMRFGFAAPYTRYVDMWDAVEVLRAVMDQEVWREPRYAARAAVT
ncbi:MAG TPA: kynureninase [Candidatus Angelobacter sp.]|nr:kynureninase [Candidatus Angelobacter sp.]